MVHRFGPPDSSTARSSCSVSFAPHSSQRSPAVSSVCSSRSMGRQAYALAENDRWSYDQSPIDLGRARFQRAGRRRRIGGTMRRLSAFWLVALLLALPAAASASPLNFITISPSVVNNGESATGTVSLSFLDPSPTTVKLFSSDPSAAQVPPTIVVPANTMETTFTITSSASAPPTGVQITAAVDNVPRTANMSVNFAAPAGGTLKSVSVTPTSVTARASATGTVTFTAAMPQGAVVNLSSSNPSVAQVPSETVVSANRSTSTFNVSTSSVTTATTVTLTAKWLGNTRTTTITVSPGAAPTADRVAIQKARCKPVGPGCLLEIQATSTNFNAILSVYSQSGNFMFNLTNNGGGRYSDSRGFIENPRFITVRSNFGGSASSTVGT